jgi:hypothetical protein
MILSRLRKVILKPSHIINLQVNYKDGKAGRIFPEEISNLWKDNPLVPVKTPSGSQGIRPP